MLKKWSEKPKEKSTNVNSSITKCKRIKQNSNIYWLINYE
jgi:hypothetical protein